MIFNGEIFKNARQKLGIHQQELAKQFGVSNFTISLWERTKIPQFEALIEASKFLGCFDELFPAELDITHTTEKKVESAGDSSKKNTGSDLALVIDAFTNGATTTEEKLATVQTLCKIIEMEIDAHVKKFATTLMKSIIDSLE